MKIVLEIELLLCIIIITLPCIKKLHPNVQVTLIDYYYYLPLSIFLVLLLPTFLHCTMYFGARSEVKWLLIHLRGPFIYYVITFLGFLDPPPPLRQHVFSTKNKQKLAFSDPPPPYKCWRNIWMVPRTNLRWRFFGLLTIY